MKELNETTRARAIELIDAIRGGRLEDDHAIGLAVVELSSLLPDPYFMAYTVDHAPELSPDEIVTRAFAYRAIPL
jgi:hypothetical protein